jgi:16S rRNA (guanine(966)-N(2))-methyltransferase RsmD
MRITGGSLCGRNVVCPPGIIRPAMDRMRESFFATLGPLDGLNFLDLFTGSGCLGLEAYSRGAWPVRVVEKDAGKRDIILKNLSMAERRIELSIMPAERFVKAWKESFDLIFLDPPFDYPYKDQLLSRILESRLVRNGSRVFMHFPDDNEIPSLLDESRRRLVMDKQKVYGRSVLNFYHVELPAEDSNPPAAATGPDAPADAQP